jgi:outer membrane protein, multidrug efflux system
MKTLSGSRYQKVYFYRYRKIFILLFLSGMFSACHLFPKVGPDTKTVEMPKNNEFLNVTLNPSLTIERVQNADLAEWWKHFNDDNLNSLITRALQNNQDKRIAESRVQESRELARIAGARLAPQIDSNVGYSRNKLSEGATLFPLPLNPSNRYSFGFDAAWEFDLFGGIRRQVEASVHNLESQEENLHDVTLTLLADVARNYFTLKSLDKRIGVAERNIQAQDESLKLVETRFQAGLVSELDVAQARAQVETTKAFLPALHEQRITLYNTLIVLLGESPDHQECLLSKRIEFPDRKKDNFLLGIIPKVPVGVPSTVLKNRPDIRRAERQLAAATANIGVARSELYPRFNITGQIGHQSLQYPRLYNDSSTFWNFAPVVSWPIFAGGRIMSNIRVQEQREIQELLTFERSLLVAFTEVENSLTSFSNEQLRYKDLRTAYDANIRSRQISQTLYREGLTDFIRVLDAERAVYASEDTLVQSEVKILTNAIALYKALGGGVVREEKM